MELVSGNYIEIENSCLYPCFLLHWLMEVSGEINLYVYLANYELTI